MTEDAAHITAAQFRERLWPSWWVWLVVVAMAGVLGTAYGAAYDPLLGWAIFAAAALIGLAFLVVTSPVIEVRGAVLRAGVARLPRVNVGSVRALDSEELTRLRRTGDARAYVVLRAWSTSRAVRIDVRDEEDPHPYWLVSTRRPEALASALADPAPQSTDPGPDPGEARSPGLGSDRAQ